MKYRFYFKNIADQDKKKIREYSRKRLRKIKRLLSPEDFRISHADLTLEYHIRHTCFTAGINLHLPFAHLHANEDSHDLLKPIDQMIDRLQLQMKKHKAKVRNENNTARNHRQIRPKELPVETSVDVEDTEMYVSEK